MGFAVIPELNVPDVAAATRTLCEVFGFVPEAGFLRAGSQRIAVVQGPGGGRDGGHGVIDHLALSVPDLDAALAAMTSRGARLDGTTPDGAQTIPEFWDGGVRYVFLQGPCGARLELCCTLAAPRAFGHDHVGIPCRDIAASGVFVQAQGARLLSAVTLRRAEGATQVQFLAFGDAVLELYQPPAPPPAPTAPPLWARLRVAGLGAAVTGPDGLTFAPLA